MGYGACVHQIEDFPYTPATEWNAAGLEKIKEEFGDTQSTIVYTGNLSSYQGIDLLIEAFAKAVSLSAESATSSRTAPRLLIVGGDKQSIAPYRALAEKLAVTQHVVFSGSRPAEEMGAFLEYADVLVSPRREGENTPLKIYSYMAAGRPIVASNIVSHTQVLSDASAYLAEPNPDSFAQALLQAIDKSDEGAKARVSKELVETRYSEKEFSKRLLKMYRDILHR